MTNIAIEYVADVLEAVMAAYGIFPEGQELDNLSSEDIKLLLQDDSANFTETQADEFIKRYDLIDHIPNKGSGFSATVFWDKIDQKYVMAFRGSEIEGFNLVTDWVTTNFEGIGRRGYAVDQAIDLYRYWRQLTTPTGQEVVHSDEKAWPLASLKVA